MDVVNPSINPPTLQPTISVKRFSQHSRGHSRSPSRSPVRPYSPLSLDPILRSLSPTATLYALTSRPQLDQDSRSPSPRRRDLKFSLSKEPDDRRALGVRAAQACLDIRGWTREIASWHWTGCFEEPEPARKKARVSMMSVGSSASATSNGTNDVEHEGKEQYLGSLPARTVLEYDKRCQEIANGLDEVDMSELKDFALSAHQSGSQSIDGLLQNVVDSNTVDDFTAVITATVLQTLPYLSELNRLLDIWTIRIAVLKQIPGFLDALERLQRDLSHGWAAIAVSMPKTGDSAILGARNMQEMQILIEERMTALGSTLDGFLDVLEGQEDTVPDAFIDRFEELEQRYATWVVDAQQRVLGDELKTHELEIPTPITPTLLISNGIDGADRARTPTFRDIERARTPIISDTDGARLPVYHEVERAKTPVFHEVDHAKTLITDSFVAPISSTDDELNGSPAALPASTADDLRRETQKSLLLRDGDVSEIASTTTGQELSSGLTEEQKYDAHDMPASVSERPVIKQTIPVESQNAVPTPAHTTSQDGHASPTSPPSDADTKFPVPDNASNIKSRKGSILSRIFKRDKSSELVRTASVTTEPAERAGRPQSSGSFAQTARRSFSRKRSSKPDQASMIWGGRPESPPLSSQPASTADHSKSIRRSLQEDRQTVLESPPYSSAVYDDQRPATAGSHSQSYEPKSLGSRPASAREPQFPENWPLGAEVADQKPDTSILHQSMSDTPLERSEEDLDEDEDIDLRTVRSMDAIDSDNFLDMFIGGFPATPSSPVVEKVKQADLAWAQLQEGPSQVTTASEVNTPVDDKNEAQSTLTATPILPPNEAHVPVVTSSMLSSNGRQDDLSVARAISIDGLRQFDRPLSQNYSDKEVNVKYVFDKRDSSLPIPLSADDAEQNAMPTMNEATGTPVSPDRQIRSDVLLLPTGSSQPGAHLPREARPDSTVLPQEMPGDETQKVLLPHSAVEPSSRVFGTDDTDDEAAPTTKHMLKRASATSIKAHAASELRSIDMPGRKRDPNKVIHSRPTSSPQTPAPESRPTTRPSSVTDVSRPGYGSTDSRSGAQSPTGSVDTPNFSRLRSSSIDTDDHKAPLSVTVAKRRAQAPNLATISPSAEYAVSPASPVAKQPAARRIEPADNFDRHVSEVLESLPAPIRFRNRAGEDISVMSQSPSARTSPAKPLRSRNAVLNRQSSGSGLTLAPAESTPRRSATADPEIKLYHLTQAGREEPIKLFVRLVGEGERVMVRVGGGWSDLADFLRQYAEHHGSRTVSGSISGLELQTASDSPVPSRRTSGVVPTVAAQRARPASRDGERTVRATVPENNLLSSPISVIEGLAELPGSEPVLPPSSRPPTSKGGKKLERKASKDALSDQKARWVTRMLEKAKRETAPPKSNKDGSFGDIGRTGSTRRVFFSSPGSKGGEREPRLLKKR